MRYLKTLQLLLSLCIANICMAQSMSFQINSIASTSNIVSSSLSFQVASNTNCLIVSNGLSIFHPKITTKQLFIECLVPLSFDHYGLTVYPQPMVDHLRIQLKRQAAATTLFSVRLYDILGNNVLETRYTGIELTYGVNLQTTNLTAGNYFLQVLSASSVDVIQVIKQD
jgi:hypothetical protein